MSDHYSVPASEPVPVSASNPAPLPPVYHARHDPDGSAKLSTTVVHALAESTGVDVTDSTSTLYDSVDPDALDSLFSSRHDGTPRTGGTLSFVVYDLRVIVHGDGRIIIEPPADGF